jgi:hypothetical protein
VISCVVLSCDFVLGCLVLSFLNSCLVLSLSEQDTEQLDRLKKYAVAAKSAGWICLVLSCLV